MPIAAVTMFVFVFVLRPHGRRCANQASFTKFNWLGTSSRWYRIDATIADAVSIAFIALNNVRRYHSLMRCYRHWLTLSGDNGIVNWIWTDLRVLMWRVAMIWYRRGRDLCHVSVSRAFNYTHLSSLRRYLTRFQQKWEPYWGLFEWVDASITDTFPVEGSKQRWSRDKSRAISALTNASMPIHDFDQRKLFTLNYRKWFDSTHKCLVSQCYIDWFIRLATNWWTKREEINCNSLCTYRFNESQCVIDVLNN